MEIDGVDRIKRGELKKGKKADATPETAQAFGETMDQAEVQERRKELDEVMQEVEEQGKRLLKNFKAEEVREYKKSVAKFLSAALGESYRLSESHSISRQGKYTAHLNLEKIEDGLDELTKAVVEGQGEPLNLLAKIDEIRGMLLDVFK
jgi:uncharacterized protein YaaR (DUF327 family)